ncbi:Glutamate receptor ionotropic, delta-2 [Picochlorum sp. SENEW3]|nr:Glutamate receptor ionotropic, delta-2 [Picochlorum sp. SENEW3]
MKLIHLSIVTIALGVAVWGQETTANGNLTAAAGNVTSSTAFIVCTIPLEPMAQCSLNSNASSSFSGLSIATFREAAKEGLGWVEGVDYKFVCVDTDTPTTLEEKILPADGVCDAFIASTTISSERTAAGVVWAYPYWSGSIGIITKSSPKSTDGWAWTKPFTWKLWLAIGLTVIILPIIVYYLEVLSIKRRVSFRDSMKGYAEATWRTLWVMIQGETMGVSMMGARIVVIVLSFVALILSASYTANLAAFLTLKSFSNVNSIYDLQGLAVSTVEVYQDRILSRYGLKTVEAVIASGEDIKDEAALVAQGVLAGFLIDAEVAQYLVATWPDCALTLLSQSIEPYDYGLAFNPRTDGDIVDAFSLSIIRLLEDGTIAEIGSTYLLDDSPCLKQGINSDEIGQITFMQVYGLWVLIAAGVVLGLFVVLALRLYKTRKDGWGLAGNMRQLQRIESEKAHNFEKGDSREICRSDLLRSESHLHDHT